MLNHNKVKADAVKNFEHGKMACSEAVLAAVLNECAPQAATKEVLAASRGFRGGIGRSGCLCGTISGGVMALGICGAVSQAKELHNSFESEHRSTCCRVLTQGVEFGSPERKQRCAVFCGEVAVKTAELIAQASAVKQADC